MGTSWQVKRKYNKKKYKRVIADIEKELVEEWERKLNGMSKAEFIRRAIKEFLGR